MKRLTLSIVGLVFLAGQAVSQRTIDEIVARVNSDIILRSEMEDELRTIQSELSTQFQGPELIEAVAEIERHLLRDLIDQSLLRQKADEYGISSDLEVLRAMEQMRQEYEFESLEALEAAIVAQGESIEDFKDAIGNQYKTQQVIQREVYSKMRISTEDLRAYYDANVADFDRPRGVRLQEIVVVTEGLSEEDLEAAKERAREAKARVDDGEEFAMVAAELSDSGTAPNGGDLGFVEVELLREDYQRIAGELRRGLVSDIVELPEFVVILKLLDRHEGGILPFDLAREEIHNIIMGQRVQPEIRKYLTALREESFVDVGEGYSDSGEAPAVLSQ